jgi:hypothetical protein
MFDYLFGSGSSDAAPSIATPPAIVNEIREQAPVMNERAAKRFAFYDSIDDYLDSDPRIRFSNWEAASRGSSRPMSASMRTARSTL